MKQVIKSWSKFINEDYDGFEYNEIESDDTDAAIWTEIRSDFIDEEANVQYIDAYTSGDDNEGGAVIATINLDTKVVSYKDERAKTDKYAQEVINDALAEAADGNTEEVSDDENSQGL